MLKSRGLRRDPLGVSKCTLSLYYYFLLIFFDLHIHITDNRFNKVSCNFHPHLTTAICISLTTPLGPTVFADFIFHTLSHTMPAVTRRARPTTGWTQDNYFDSKQTPDSNGDYNVLSNIAFSRNAKTQILVVILNILFPTTSWLSLHLLSNLQDSIISLFDTLQPNFSSFATFFVA